MRVLICGAAGRLGTRLTKRLEGHHDLVLGDVKPIADPRFVHVDVTDLAAVRAAMQGCDAVVYMVIFDWPSCSDRETLRYGVPCVQVHVAGLHNVLHAALDAGVRRFVYTSSVSAVDGLPAGTQVDPETRPYSNAIYGLTKGFGEDLCRMFHYTYGLSVTVLRLGTLFAPENGGAWIGNVYHPDPARCPAPGTATSRVHVDDATRAVQLALQAQEPAYALVHVVGADSGHRWDLGAARRLLGWDPDYAFDANGLPRARSERDGGAKESDRAEE